MTYDIGRVLRMANFCGDCGRKFEDGVSTIAMRLQPARLICEECKRKECATRHDDQGPRMPT